MKRALKIFLMLSLSIGLLLGGCANKKQQHTPSPTISSTPSPTPTPRTSMKLILGKGAGSMSLVNILEESSSGKLKNDYTVNIAKSFNTLEESLSGANAAVLSLPDAATLYNTTHGGVQMVAVLAESKIGLVTKDSKVSLISDLKGKKIGVIENSSAHCAIKYLIKNRQLTGSVTIEYVKDLQECEKLLESGDCVVIAEPYVTTLVSNVKGAKLTIDISKQWNRTTMTSTGLLTECIVVNKEFLEKNEPVVEKFLEDCQSSIDYLIENPKKGLEAAVKHGLTANAKAAERAFDDCQIAIQRDEIMQAKAQFCYDTMFFADYFAFGGTTPGIEFYYTTIEEEVE